MEYDYLPTSTQALAAEQAKWRAEEDYTEPAAFGIGYQWWQGDKHLTTTFLSACLVDEDTSNTWANLHRALWSTGGDGSYYYLDSEHIRLFLVLMELEGWLGDASPYAKATELLAELGSDGGGGRERFPVIVTIDSLNDAPVDASDVLLRLCLMSQRDIKPQGCNLDGLEELLPLLIWTSHGPFLRENFSAPLLSVKLGQEVTMKGTYQVPRMADAVPMMPYDARVGEGATVALGAYLGEGTMVDAGSFVSHNAGTLGGVLVQGHIGPETVVGDKTWIQNGAQIFGFDEHDFITIGEGCTIGTHANVHVSLGDNCNVESGCLIRPDVTVWMFDADKSRLPSKTSDELGDVDGLDIWMDNRTNGLAAWIRPPAHEAVVPTPP